MSTSPAFRLPGSAEPAHEEHRLPAAAPPPGVWIDWGPPPPESWHQDRLMLLVRDPFCVYAYWELTGEHARWLPERHGAGIWNGSRWLVRLLSHGAVKATVAAAHPLGNWYFDAEPDTPYGAEIGLEAIDGSWIVVATGPSVRTPRAGVAPIVDDDWAVTEEELMELLGISREEAAARRAWMLAQERAGYGPPRPDASSR